MTGRRRNLLVGLAVLAVAAVVIVVVAVSGRSGSNGSTAEGAERGSASTTAGPGRTTGTGASGAPTTESTVSGPGAGSGRAAATTTTEPMPLRIRVSGTQGLHDGSAVTVTVTADEGSQYFGLDARLCAGTTPIGNFYDYTPDPAGNCILKPLSAASDAYVVAANAPPYQTGTMTFHVGVGTESFTTENLTKPTITCGPDHPCQLVLRLQYPHGFGFRSYPITYAR